MTKDNKEKHKYSYINLKNIKGTREINIYIVAFWNGLFVATILITLMFVNILFENKQAKGAEIGEEYISDAEKQEIQLNATMDEYLKSMSVIYSWDEEYMGDQITPEEYKASMSCHVN